MGIIRFAVFLNIMGWMYGGTEKEDENSKLTENIYTRA